MPRGRRPRAARRPAGPEVQPRELAVALAGAATESPPPVPLALAGLAAPYSAQERLVPAFGPAAVPGAGVAGAPRAGVAGLPAMPCASQPSAADMAAQYAQASMQHAQAAAVLWSLVEMAQATLDSTAAPAAAPQRLDLEYLLNCQVAQIATSNVCGAGSDAGSPLSGFKHPQDALDGSNVSTAGSTTGSQLSHADTPVCDVSSEAEYDCEGELVVKNTFLSIEPTSNLCKSLRNCKTAPGVLSDLDVPDEAEPHRV